MQSGDSVDLEEHMAVAGWYRCRAGLGELPDHQERGFLGTAPGLVWKEDVTVWSKASSGVAPHQRGELFRAVLSLLVRD